MVFMEVQTKKKTLEKLRKCCSIISKINLNSPCLLQIVRSNGEFDFIITHDCKNGSKFNFLKVFEITTYDEFQIKSEDLKLFDSDDGRRTSIPIIVSSTDLIKCEEYNYSTSSFYIFPNFMLDAIRNNAVESFEYTNDGINNFIFNILYSTDARYKSTLFIENTDTLKRLFSLDTLPLQNHSNLSNLYMINKSDFVCAYTIIDGKEWEELFEKNRFNNCMVLDVQNNHKLLVYHHDFIPKKVKQVQIYKTYEKNSKNVVSLYFMIELLNNYFMYFKYSYFEID